MRFVSSLQYYVDILHNPDSRLDVRSLVGPTKNLWSL